MPPNQNLVVVYLCRMTGVCSWYAHNKEEAEEFLQVGFIRVFNYINRFRGTGSLKGRMRRLIINDALLKYKSKSSHLKPLLITLSRSTIK